MAVSGRSDEPSGADGTGSANGAAAANGSPSRTLRVAAVLNYFLSALL